MLRFATITWLALLTALPAASGAVDLNGRWRFESGGVSTIVPVTQTGSSLSIPFGLPFTGTVDPPDVNGFSNYQVSWTSGGSFAGFGGHVLPSGNLLDGAGGAFIPPSPPSGAGVVATRCSCFDGNGANGDGCDAACQIEPCWTCSGDPSVCTPTADGGACDDGSPCTTGETCTAGVCGGGAPVAPCFDMNGPWTRHQAVPDLGVTSDTMVIVVQRDMDLRLGAYVGTINPATAAFDVRAPNLNLFCSSFDRLMGSLAPDGRTYAASGYIEEPRPFAPDQCDQFAITETGDHCGNGVPEDAEACDDGNLTSGDGCSAQCVVEPCSQCSGTPSVCGPAAGGSCDDGNACTSSDTCAGDGSCAGSPVTCEPCFACDATLGCIAQPQPMCKASTAPEKSIASVKNDADDAMDRFTWRWSKGADTLLGELGDPTSGDDVTLCVYDESTATTSLLFRATIPAGPTWTASAAGFRYWQSSATADGMALALLKSGSGATASAKLKGKGVHLSDRPHGLPVVPLPLPLRVQLQGENGLCLETRHDSSSVLENDAVRGLFKARGIP